MAHFMVRNRWSMLIMLAAMAMLPSVALAQTSAFDGGVAESEEPVEMPRLRALGTLLTHISTPELMLADCFRECFARDEGARAETCGPSPNLAVCLNRSDVPACVVARRTPLVGVNIFTAASCSPSVIAPITRTASAPSAEELARRQQRREVAMRDCAGQGRFVNACVTCTSSLRGNTWLSANTDRARNIILVAIRGSSSPQEAEANFRCVSPQMRAYNNLLAATRADVTTLETRVSQVTQEVASLQTGGGSNGFSSDVAQALAEIIDALGFEQASHEYERAMTDARVCEMSAPAAALPVEDRGRPVAPADMMFWPVRDVRRQGFRPRTPTTAVRCGAERERVAIARGQLDRYSSDPSHVSVERLSDLTVFLNAITRQCSSNETVDGCVAAREGFRTFMNRRSPAQNQRLAAQADETVAVNGR